MSESVSDSIRDTEISNYNERRKRISEEIWYGQGGQGCRYWSLFFPSLSATANDQNIPSLSKVCDLNLFHLPPPHPYEYLALVITCLIILIMIMLMIMRAITMMTMMMMMTLVVKSFLLDLVLRC